MISKHSGVSFFFHHYYYFFFSMGREGLLGVDHSKAWFLLNIFNRLKLYLSSPDETACCFVCLLASSV